MTPSDVNVRAGNRLGGAIARGAVAADRLVRALALPLEARVDQRIPKKLFQEHGAPTAADRRLLQEGIEEAHWVAALKPSTVGTPAYRDEVREYLEITVLTISLRAVARAARVVELVHRAVPYPVVLVTTQGEGASLSLAHKRRSQAATGDWVVERVESTASLDAGESDGVEAAFLASLALAEQPALNLYATYQGVMDRLTALAAARLTGHYRLPDAIRDAPAMRAAVDEHARLSRELASLRAQATSEKQLARRVELNLEIRRVDVRLANLLSTL